MSYEPSTPPDDSPLARWLQEELQSLADELLLLEENAVALELRVTALEP